MNLIYQISQMHTVAVQRRVGSDYRFSLERNYASAAGEPRGIKDAKFRNSLENNQVWVEDSISVPG